MPRSDRAVSTFAEGQRVRVCWNLLSGQSSTGRVVMVSRMRGYLVDLGGVREWIHADWLEAAE